MDIKEQNEQLKSALIRLVDLKHYKDKFGKDDFYLANQPETWEFARITLKSVGVFVADTEANDNKHAVNVSGCYNPGFCHLLINGKCVAKNGCTYQHPER